MKTKHITAAVIFAATFGASVFFVGVPQTSRRTTRTFSSYADSRTAMQISLFLQQDDDNGRLMEANIKNDPSPARYAEAVSRYVSHSEELEDVNLPPDFRYAWHEHLEAWRAQAEFLQASDLSDEAILDAEFLGTYRRQNAEIRRTWFDVLDVAEKYGAAIPEGAY